MFRLWARSNARIELVLQHGCSARSVQLERQPSGMYETHVASVDAGTRYWYKIDDAGPFPDPASRYQPLGVHGPSELIVQPDAVEPVADFHPPSLRELIVYELHVGAFSAPGTFLGAIEKLDHLRALGITAIELMPIADFAGSRNWGYDGVFPYAPAHIYGAPADLRALVREAHRRGIAVFLDVVYNHLGPDGAYQATFAPAFYSHKHKTPWGDSLNFDADAKEMVRSYFIGSALMWIRDYRFDGLRVDATHAIRDDSSPPFLTELTERIHGMARSLGREVFVIAEDERNERNLVLSPAEGGNGFDAVWSDDFHHHLRHRLAGDSDGYYRGFDGATKSIVVTINEGWFFHGQPVGDTGKSRGTTPAGLSRESRLFCIQNHDQVGNRAFGERLSSQISQSQYYASTTLLLLAPEIPLLFMGQEWAAPEPFLYFTNHNGKLGQLVTEGRRREFEHFTAFKDEAQRQKIPDPQLEETFRASRLDWDLRLLPDHAACLRWYEYLLRVRKHIVPNARFIGSRALTNEIVLLKWQSRRGELSAAIALGDFASAVIPDLQGMRLMQTSEDDPFVEFPFEIGWSAESAKINFQRPGAAIFARGDLAFGSRNETE